MTLWVILGLLCDLITFYLLLAFLLLYEFDPFVYVRDSKTLRYQNENRGHLSARVVQVLISLSLKKCYPYPLRSGKYQASILTLLVPRCSLKEVLRTPPPPPPAPQKKCSMYKKVSVHTFVILKCIRKKWNCGKVFTTGDVPLHGCSHPKVLLYDK